ncbi:hypothetical protein NC651_005303 [Populus alba x Populus x berolinensis]|nr:hypothetical protein NC651_005303 [Populus alba x Populus x berolinensis]
MILDYTSPAFLISDHEADKTKPFHCSSWGGSHLIEFHFLLFKLFNCYVFSPSESNTFQSSTINLKLKSSLEGTICSKNKKVIKQNNNLMLMHAARDRRESGYEYNSAPTNTTDEKH